MSDVLEKLERLGALLASGVLTQEEFQAQKALILGSTSPQSNNSGQHGTASPQTSTESLSSSDEEVIKMAAEGLMVIGLMPGLFEREHREMDPLIGEDFTDILLPWVSRMADHNDPLIASTARLLSKNMPVLEAMVFTVDDAVDEYETMDEFMASRDGVDFRQRFQKLLDGCTKQTKEALMYEASQLEIMVKKHVCVD